MSKSAIARDLRDPAALPTMLRKLGLQLPPEWPAAAETRDILEHAADELERLQHSIGSVMGDNRISMHTSAAVAA
jgi:hypothetical protein